MYFEAASAVRFGAVVGLAGHLKTVVGSAGYLNAVVGLINHPDADLCADHATFDGW